MPTPIKAIADIVEAWASYTPARSDRYAKYGSVAGDNWLRETTAAADNWHTAVTMTTAQTFAGGARKAGAAKFNRKVKDVGVARFGPGVAAAKSDYNTGFAPYAEVIAAVTPPARGPRGAAQNYQIPQAYGDPLHAKRLALRAAGG